MELAVRSADEGGDGEGLDVFEVDDGAVDGGTGLIVYTAIDDALDRAFGLSEGLMGVEEGSRRKEGYGQAER